MSLHPLGGADDDKALLAPTLTPSGFPSQPAEFAELPLNINDVVCPNPQTTYYFRAVGAEPGPITIYNDDILIIDRSIKLCDGALVVYVEDEAFAVRRVLLRAEQIVLLANDPTLPEIIVQDEESIFGVISHVIHSCLPPKMPR